MELVRDHLDVEASGPILGQFQLGINEKDFSLAMDILIDLYQDPKGSVVRELGSNAYDANKVAGRGHLPIEVTLPTPLSPCLVIRDRGNGMTIDFVKGTYSKLLSSSKRDNNDEIGGYGIGSKSPLGYTDSYTVSTRAGGEEVHIHISRNGGFTLLGSNKTSKDDGTTVTVPVSANDCKAFSEAVQWLRYMDPPPLINGLPMAKEEILLEGDTWFIAKNNTPYNPSPCILLGPIPYPLDIHKLGLGNMSSNPSTCVASSNFMRLKLPIGSLTVTPSRESLRYDEKTISTIKEALLDVYSPCMDAIEGLLKSCEWEVDARTLSYQYSFNNWWRHSNRNSKYKDSTNLPIGEKWVMYSYNTWKGTVVSEKTTYYPSSGAEVYLHDKPLRSKMRIEAYVRAKGRDFNLLVGPHDSKVTEMKLFPTKLLSTLPDVEADEDEEVDTPTAKSKKVLDRLQRGNIRAKVWSGACVHPERVLLYSNTTDGTMPLDGEGYYLPMSAGKVMHSHVLRDMRPNNIEQMRSILGIEDQPLYVVSPQNVQRLGPNWKDLAIATHEYVEPWLVWLKYLYLSPTIPMSLYRVTSDGLARKAVSEGWVHKYLSDMGLGGYLIEYVKLLMEAEKFTKPKPYTIWSRVLDLYTNHFTGVWDGIPFDIDKNPLKELAYLVNTVYPLLEGFRVDGYGMKHYLGVIDANLDGGDGWYRSCKLTEGRPLPTMDGRDLMIYYYGSFGDVRGYYERYEQYKQ